MHAGTSSYKSKSKFDYRDNVVIASFTVLE